MNSSEEKKEQLIRQSEKLRADLAETIEDLKPALGLVETGFAFARTASTAGRTLWSLKGVLEGRNWGAIPAMIWRSVAARWL